MAKIDVFRDLPEDTPIYELLKDCYMEDDTLHPEGEQIAYTGTPNEFMEPLNEAARLKMRTYLDYLDDCGRKAAEKFGRVYTGRITDLGDQIAQAMGDARAEAQSMPIAMPKKRDIPQRPDLATPAQRKLKPSKLLASRPVPPEGPRQAVPISVQGKNYDNDAASNSTL